VVAFIAARGGSKGVSRKNERDFCGRPLVSWSIIQALSCDLVESVWVSSDDDSILRIAESSGAKIVKRPLDLASDDASSESAWTHTLDVANSQGCFPDLIMLMQCTSPLREVNDLTRAISIMQEAVYDSMLSVSAVEDYFVWKKDDSDNLFPVNYDYRNRLQRQKIEKKFLENGSFYICKPDILRAENNRLGGRITHFLMDRHKMFQIDSEEDFILCEAIMRAFNLDLL